MANITKAPTQAPLIPITTPFQDSKSASGVSFAWLQALQALQRQKPFNPILIAAALSPLTVDSAHNVLFVTTGAGAFSLILGPAKTSPFSMYVVIKADAGAGAITITPNGIDTINGGGPLAQAATRWRTTVLIPDGKSNWVAFSVTGGG